MNAIRKLYSDHVAICSTVTVIVLMGLLHFIRTLPMGYEMSYVVSDGVVAVIILFLLYAINGEGEFLFSTKGIGYAFKVAWWLLVIAFAGFVFLMLNYMSKGTAISGNPILVVLGAALLSVFVGYFEEGLFRGIVLSAFLDKFGDTFKGIFWSCVISSIIFGFIHVYLDFLGFFIDPSSFSVVALLQVIGKTISAGLIGFVLAVIFLRTHSLTCVAIIHGLNDFATFVPTFLYNQPGLTHYVNANDAGAAYSPIGYLIQFLIFLPMVIYAYKQLKKVSIPQWGMFKKPYYPHSVKKGE